MKKAIINATIFTGESVLKDKAIIIENGLIVAIQDTLPENIETINLEGKNIAPGMIDIQINGGGHLFFSQYPNETGLRDIEEACLAFGTTHFLPTLISSTKENIFKAIDAVRDYKSKYPNTGVLGMHLEGPFFNPEKRGAHNKNIVRKPTDEELEAIVHHGKDVIKIFTIAPEMFTDRQIDFLLDSGIQLSAGHSNMLYEQAQHYFNKGIKLVTHMYNAMSAFTHRFPGLAGATMDNKNVYASIILDGHHCHYASARIAYQEIKEKLVLITDSAFLGRKVKHFEWDTFDATLQNNTYRNKEGNLAGAAISMVEAVVNAKNNLPISLQEAIEMATSRAAKAIGFDKQIGYIKAGYPAKFFVFDDEVKNYASLILN